MEQEKQEEQIVQQETKEIEETTKNTSRELSKRLAALQSMCNLLDWEGQAGDVVWENPDSGKMALGQLKKLRRELILSDKGGECCAKESEGRFIEIAEKRELSKLRQREKRFTKKQAQRQEEICEQAAKVWDEALQAEKEHSKGELSEGELKYQKLLEEEIKLLRETLPEGEGYERFLLDYEGCYEKQKVDAFFAECKEVLQPLIKTNKKRQERELLWEPKESYAPERQRQLARFLSEYLGFDFSRGRMGESAHPFTTAIGQGQVCWSNRYVPENPFAGIFSALHESGHGIYEQNIARELTGTVLAGGSSSAMHEAVARFYENMIGREEAFWEPIYGKVQEILGGEFERASLADFMGCIRRIHPGCLRTEADELTYPFHIIIRYELEQELFSGALMVSELSEKWKEKYQEYLGVEPSKSEEGYLQDIHWSCGQFGYFPAYQMGNAIAAQIYYWVKKTLPLEALLRQGKLACLKAYLTSHLFRYGLTKTSEELLLSMTGESLHTGYYLEYLKERYEKSEISEIRKARCENVWRKTNC